MIKKICSCFIALVFFLMSANISWAIDFEVYDDTFHTPTLNYVPINLSDFNGQGFSPGSVSSTGNITADGNMQVDGYIQGGSLSSDSTLTVTGASTLNGIDNNSGNITEAGAISGATTINASGTITGGNLSTGGTLGVSGTSTLAATNITGTTNINTGAGATTSIGNAAGTNTIAGATGITGVTTITSSGTANQAIVDATSSRLVSTGGSTVTAGATAASVLTLDGSGLTANNAGTVSLGNATASGAGLSILSTGAVSLENNAASGAGLNISADGNTVSLLNDIGGGRGLSITGTVTTLSGGTNSSTWTLQDGSATLGVGTDAPGSELQVFQATNVAGVTAVTIGGVNNSSNQLLATRVGGTNLIQANAGASIVSNQITATTGNNAMTATAGSNTISADAAGQSNTISAINGTNNLNAITNNIGVTGLVGVATTTNIGTGALQSTNNFGNTNALTRINGSGGNSALSVANNASSLKTTSFYGAGDNGLSVTDTTAGVTVNNQNNVANGMSVGNTTGSFLVENTATNERHGIEINQTRTVLSGGTTSTYMVLDDNGATFSDGSEGSGVPVQVHGVADGTARYDAVNYGQFRDETNRINRNITRAYAGVASVAAMASIPPPVPGKRFSIGTGYGNFEGANAFAVGGKAKVTENTMASASIGLTDGSPTTGIGIGYSF